MIRKLALCVAVLCLLGSGALAETFGRGYVRPPDWDRTFQEHLRVFPADKDDLPAVWDWRTMNGVTPVKNQGSCGSCSAFAAAAEMEAKIRIYYGNRVLDLSEQQIISCNPYGSGCGGGWAGSPTTSSSTAAASPRTACPTRVPTGFPAQTPSIRVRRPHQLVQRREQRGPDKAGPSRARSARPSTRTTPSKVTTAAASTRPAA